MNKEKIKVFTAFSGYDSQCLALNRLKDYDKNFDYELVGWSEIDKHAILAHDALFPEAKGLNYGDISKVDWKNVPDFDLFTYSSPCTDFSTAGLQAGGTEGSGTRSSLLWECKRTIEEKRPKYLLFENVVALLSNKFINVFEKWVKLVRSMGYNSYYQILNAKDYGIAHNRPRVFMVSIRNDIDLPYTFPGTIDERPHLYEYLQPDSEVDPKYWRTPERKNHYLELNKDAIAKLDNKKNSFAGYDVIPCGLYCHCSDRFNSAPIYDIARCLKAESIESGILYKKDGEWFERLFTQRECFRLMGLTDEEYDKLSSVVTPHQQSKMAGNSIVVDVIYHIFRKLFTDIEPDKYTQNVLF